LSCPEAEPTKRHFRHIAEALDQVVQDKLASLVIGLRIEVDRLKLSSAFRTAVCVSLRGESIKARCFGGRDARPIFADGVDGQALELRLRHSPEDVLQITVEPDAGRFSIIVRSHNCSHTLGQRCAPANVNPLIPSRGLENRD
jgi:hypothetical protein